MTKNKQKQISDIGLMFAINQEIHSLKQANKSFTYSIQSPLPLPYL